MENVLLNAIETNISQGNSNVTSESTVSSNTSQTIKKDNFSSILNDDISTAFDNQTSFGKDPLEETSNNTPAINYQLINEMDSNF